MLLARWRPSGRPALFLSVAAAAAAAALAGVAFAVAPSADNWALASFFDFLRSAATIGFLLGFLGVRDATKGASRAGGGWAVLVTVGVVLLAAQLLLSVPPPGTVNAELTNEAHGFAAELAVAVFGLVLVEQCYRRTPAASRWHVRPLLIALGGVLAFDVFLYADGLLFRVLDRHLWAGRGFAYALAVPLLRVTMTRTRNWSFELSLSRDVMMGTTALLAAGAYLLLLSGAGFLLRQVGGSWGRALESALVFASMLLLVLVALSATVRAKVKVHLAKNFFSYRYDYRAEWLRLTNSLSSGSAARPWASCIQALGELVESGAGALWFRAGDGSFRQIEQVGLPACGDAIADDDPLPRFLRRTGWVVEIADAARHPGKYGELALPVAITRVTDAWIVVPLRTSNELVGFVVLGAPRVTIELDWEVLDLLKTAGRQTASYLAHAQATEALLEARKFDAFHRMSTFVVHDLKNLIAQLKLLLSNAERHHDNPDFQRDMLKTIEHVVGRMHQLTLQLRPEASGQDRAQPVDVGAVARRIAGVRAVGPRGLRVETVEGALAWGHEDLLERVISHLVQNALDASDGDPHVSVRVANVDDGVLVEVADHGRGMTPEFVRDRLFRPFQTTKEGGMGIGAFECQQYVRQVGGRIEVHSVPGAGTRVRIHLRAAASARSATEARA
jgi:putative PEP-CTERM system histidine kinase